MIDYLLKVHISKYMQELVFQLNWISMQLIVCVYACTQINVTHRYR